MEVVEVEVGEVQHKLHILVELAEAEQAVHQQHQV
jgi:hypothetical protein